MNMGERYLYQKCPFLKEVGQERRSSLKHIFELLLTGLLMHLLWKK